MSHLDPDVAALIALGEAATPDDLAHLADCAACTSDVDALRRAVTAGRASDGAGPLLTPPPRVWDAIRAELQLDEAAVGAPPAPDRRPDSPAAVGSGSAPAAGSAVSDVAPAPGVPPVPAAEGRHRVPRRGRGRRNVVFALIAAVAVVAVVAGTWVARELTRPQVSIIAAAVLDGFPAHPGAEGEAVLEEADGHTRIVVNIDADLADDGYREVWLLASDGSGLVSLGMLDGRSGTFAIPAGVDLEVFSLVDVSQEETDGDPAHSGDSIVRGELEPA